MVSGHLPSFSAVDDPRADPPQFWLKVQQLLWGGDRGVDILAGGQNIWVTNRVAARTRDSHLPDL